MIICGKMFAGRGWHLRVQSPVKQIGIRAIIEMRFPVRIEMRVQFQFRRTSIDRTCGQFEIQHIRTEASKEIWLWSVRGLARKDIV